MSEMNRVLPLKRISINDKFWSEYTKLVKEVVIPYQWEALNDRVPDAEPSHAVANFKIAAGMEEGKFYGAVFQDSDVYKWLEAVGYSLQVHPDAELEKTADEMIDIIEKAQGSDGYLNTYFTLEAPDKRWTNLKDCHELYCAGHFIEAAVAYYNATGKRKILDIACKFADYIDSVFGPEEHKLKGYPGHEEIELALVKLYETTGAKRYLNLAKYFIDERGKNPYYFTIEWEKRNYVDFWSPNKPLSPETNRNYYQTHKPVREQEAAVGHSVRAAYLYTGMADIAARTNDKELMDACKRLWNNIVSTQMYITGGIGSTRHGEAFTFDYELPNDTVYSETCAAIGLIFFAQRMLRIENKSCYADVIERALYNTVLASMAKDGKHFFYVNPLEVWPEASMKNPTKQHIKPVRQKWFGCACCPPNVARLLSSIGHYMYTMDDNSIYAHLYMGSSAEFDINGANIVLEQATNYPWDGEIIFKVSVKNDTPFRLGLRIPGWCNKAGLKVNGEPINLCEIVKDGYAIIDRTWKNNDTVLLTLDMPVEIIQANPRVRANAGKVAIQRGPLVYCIEEADNGPILSSIALTADTKLTARYDDSFLGGAVIITGNAERVNDQGWNGQLYRPYKADSYPVNITAIPYYLWGNREPGEMLVWIRNR